MDGAGFEPAASTMPTIKLETLESFKDFLKVNMRLEHYTVRQNMQDVKRFLEMSDYVVTYENVKQARALGKHCHKYALNKV
jgi:glutaredoxin-related protein